MSFADVLIREAKTAGLSLRIEGERVVLRYQESRRTELAALIDKLKAHKDEVENLLRNTSAQPTEAIWPNASSDAERRFGQPHARLFPFIGRKVRTPKGPGTLLQVFVDRVTVALDSEISRCSSFSPLEIEPTSWELL